MGDFVVNADVLATARFGTSPLTETLAALLILHTPSVDPWHRAWRDQHYGDYLARLSGDPVTVELVRHAFSATWTADFLTVPPTAPDLDFEDELVHLQSLSDDQVRTDLEAVSSPLPPVLSKTHGLDRRAADLLRWVWAETVAPDWERRRRVLQADIVARTSRLATQGWAGALADIGPGVQWLGNDRLQVNQRWYPTRDIRGAELIFIAAHTPTGWVSWHLPDRYGVVYPVTGIFATDPPSRTNPLARLLGANRAQILLHCQQPTSTSALAAQTGQTLGSVGGHLRILLDAGLLHRRRSGHHVLYWQSHLGQHLVTTTGS